MKITIQKESKLKYKGKEPEEQNRGRPLQRRISERKRHRRLRCCLSAYQHRIFHISCKSHRLW